MAEHRSVTPTALLGRLSAIAESVAARNDAIALLGLGSCGHEIGRLDEWSDLDFFVVVDDGAKAPYLRSIDWLETAGPVAYSFENTVDGRKALFDDGVFVEYAVFTAAELAGIPHAGGRVVWRRAGTADELLDPPRAPVGDHHSVDFHAQEALTNLLVGLKRESRGEHVSAFQLIQQHAFGHVLAILAQGGSTASADPFDPSRRIELRHPELGPALAAMTPGSERNASAAIAVLAWLEVTVPVDQRMRAEIRQHLAALSTTEPPSR